MAPPPPAGAVVRGPILQIDDGASVCVAKGAQPLFWTRIKLRGVDVSRPLLMAAAFGKNAACVIGADGLADCMVEGVPLRTLSGQPAVIKASLSWR
jgi:hypothetical protein